MFALRCLRLASGVTLDGVRIEHTQWLAVNSLTDTQDKFTVPDYNKAEGVPYTIPLLEVVVFDKPNDPILRGLPVVMTDDSGSEIEPSSTLDDLEQKTRAQLAEIAISLDIKVAANDNRATIIARIRASREVIAPEVVPPVANGVTPEAVVPSTTPAPSE